MIAEEGRMVVVGDIVQIDPDHDPRFGGCLLVVTELKSWGVQGYVTVPANPESNLAFYRAKWGEIEAVGHAIWVRRSDEDRAWGEAAKKAERGGFVGEEASRSLLEEADRQ